jgi:hypothetical protein
LVGTGNVIKLPTVSFITLILEHSVVSVKIFRRFRPALNVAPSSDSRTRVNRRAAIMGPWVFAASSAFTACTANKVSFQGVAGNWAQNVWIFFNLFCVVDSCTDTHAIFAIGFFISQLRGTDVLIERAFGRAAVEFSEIRIIDANESARDWAEVHVQIISVDVAEIVEVWPS